VKYLNYDHLGGGPILYEPQKIEINKKKTMKKDPKKLFIKKENFSAFVKNQENLDKEKIIRKGLNITKEGNFWDYFIKICDDSNALSKLLNVPKEKITSWAGEIRNVIQEVKNKDSKSISAHKKLI
jgi:hypothetical protein